MEERPRLKLPPALEKLSLCYAVAKDLFYPDRVKKGLERLVPASERGLAIGIFLLSGLIVFAMSFLTSLESIYLANYASELISEVKGIPMPSLELSSLLPVVAYQFIIYVVLALALALIFEGISFGLFRISGGRGKFREQLFLASIISLAFSFTTALSLLMPIPLLNVVSSLAIIVATGYLVFYVTTKAYTIVHDVSFMHALVVLVISGLPRIAVTIFAMQALAAALGLASPTDIQGV